MLSLLGLLWASDLDDGIAALKAHQTDVALVALNRCVANDPQNVECWWELGWARYVQRDWAGVITAWSKVQALQPDFPDLEKQLAAVRALQNDGSAMVQARTAAPATLAPKAPKGTVLRLKAVGDMMIGTDFPDGALPPDGGAGAFAKVSSQLKDADITFGNLEGPLCDGGTTTKCAPDATPGSCYAFRTPTAYAHWYKDAGFDVVSTANNHAGDFGAECRTQTEAAMATQGIYSSGRQGTIATWTSNGRKITLIAFAPYDTTNNFNDDETLRSMVQQAAANSDIVIVSFHGGAEGSKAIHVPQGGETFYGENRGDLRHMTHLAIDAGADLLIGHGPHVLRGMEVYKERLIMYSLGNFSTYGRFNLNGNQGIGAIVDVRLDEDGRFLGGQILGTRQEGRGTPIPDPNNAAADLIRLMTLQDFTEYGVTIAQDGTIGY